MMQRKPTPFTGGRMSLLFINTYTKPPREGIHADNIHILDEKNETIIEIKCYS